ncbi:MAG: DUF4139 domain-containing protein [Gemmatimonadetes bacterium]|nr:DUF4139 domain-containing protein [Gemmatimonadota bacterium]
MFAHQRSLLFAAVLGGAGLVSQERMGARSAPQAGESARAGASSTGQHPEARPIPGRAIGTRRDTTGFRSTAQDRESVAITVYNQNFGLVREVRDVAFTRGIAPLEFADVAQHVQPETVHIKALDGGLRILEQNYQFDLLNPQKLLEKYVGRTITVWRYNSATQQEEPLQAEVLSVNGGPILRIGGEITYNVPGRLSFPEIPDNLIAEPTLMWRLSSERPRHRLEVSYLTNQLNWKADYVFVIDDADRRGDLTGWVTLTNQSGAAYENAMLKLVAGDVRRITPDPAGRMRLEARTFAADELAAQFSEENFFEYHLYTLDRPTTLLQNEQKQVTLLESAGIGLDKRLIFYGAAEYYRGAYGQVVSNQKVGVFLDFQNTERNRLGMPLPKGTVRVYKADKSGALQFIGEDAIDHTPKDERVRIRMGEAFDVVGDRRQMEYNVISGCVSESTWEVTVRNHKNERITVDVIEPVGGDWEVLQTSHPFQKLDAHTFAYNVGVPSNGETKIRYRVRVRWC